MGWKPKALDLFAGCGGLSLGFEQAGFEVIAANDKWDLALKTFERNFPSTKIVKGDVTRKRVQDQIIKVCGNDIDVIIGGPPCQAFSLAGTRDPADPRGKLFQAYVEIVDETRPSVFVVENVTGILSMRHFRGDVPEKERQNVRKMIEKRKSQRKKVSIEKLNSQISQYLITVPKLIQSEFRKLGYRVEWEKGGQQYLNAADYGVPQSRTRVFFIGSRLSKPVVFPVPTHSKNPNTLLRSWVTLKEAIGDLPFPSISEGDDVYEGSFSSIYMSRNRRREWGEVSYTIQAGARHIPLHPGCPPMKKVGEDEWVFGDEPIRRLSVRECARIQTFPDDFIFLGKTEEKYKQIGNAVPPLLARRIANCVKEMLE